MRILGLSSLMVVVACSANGPTATDPGTLAITGIPSVLVPGVTAQLAATARDAAGNPVSGVSVAFASESPSVVTLTPGGALVAVGAGSFRIRASAEGFADATLLGTVATGALVGPDGGTYSVPTLEAELTVPAAAVTTPTPVLVAAVPAPIVDPAMMAAGHLSVTVPSGMVTMPVQLRMRVPSSGAPFGLPFGALGPRVFDGASYADVAGSVDEGSMTATATVSLPVTVGIGRRVPTTPCTDAPYRQFDFWLGAWEVFVESTKVANSTITAEPGGCAILENYRPFSGVGGRSISIYIPATATWYQTYVGDLGGRLLISGSAPSAGRMTLRTPGGSVFERWSWTLLGDGSVTQVAQVTSDGGATFASPSWNSVYRRP